MLELCYTSAPKGIRPGSSGYTTVAYTKDMPTALLQRLEGLSTFDHVDKNAAAYARNPVNHAHLAFGSGQQRVHVVSRIAACEPDHSGRTNYFAHHVLVTEPESRGLTAGPAAMAAGESLFMGAWTGEPRLLPARPLPAVRDAGSADGAAWQAAGLDAGWAGYLADRVQQRGKPAYVICPKHVDALALVADVVAVVPADQRWNVTFATHATAGFPGLGVECQLRFVVAGTAYAAEVKAKHRGDCIDLTTRPAAPEVTRQGEAGDAAAPGGGGTRAQTQGAGDRYSRPAIRSSGARDPDASRTPTTTAAERGGFAAPERPARKSFAAWMLAASTLVATVAAAFFAYDGYRWRQEAEDQRDLVQRKEDEIKALNKKLARATRAGSQEAAPEASAGSTDTERPDSEVHPSSNQGEITADTTSGRPEGTNGGSDANPPPEPARSSATHAFTIDEAKTRMARVRGEQDADVTLVTGLGKDDAVTIGIRHGADVLECDVAPHPTSKSQWLVTERSGSQKKLATFKREGDKLSLKIPKGDLLRLVTFVVGVTPGGSGTEMREEFSLADPITATVDVTPATKPKGGNPAVTNCGNEFSLFSDKAASERFARILAGAPDLELHVQFPGPRHAGSVERDGSRQCLVIRRLQTHDGTPCDAGKYEVCGIALDVPIGDPKAAKGGLFPLAGWWIQDPRAGAPDKDRGIRVSRSWDDETVLAPLKDKVKQAQAAAEAAAARTDDPKIKADQAKYNEAVAASNKRNKELDIAVEAVRKCEQALQDIRRTQQEMPLKDFQGVPMRITLRRPGVEDEIVLVDSSGT